MGTKLKKALVLIIVLFLGGSLISFIGFSKGKAIAIILSRPIGATGWTTSQEMILGCTFTPVIMGASLIILSILLFAVLFINWFHKPN